MGMTIFHDLIATEKSSTVFVKYVGDYYHAGVIENSTTVALSAVLAERALSFITFVDIYDLGQRDWIKKIKDLRSAFSTTELASILIMVVLGKKNGNVGNPGGDYATFWGGASETGYASFWDVPFLLGFNDTLAGSVGEAMLGGFTYVSSVSEIVTPMSCLIANKGSGTFRVLDKMHMDANDDGNGEYGASSSNPSVVANDLISNHVGDVPSSSPVAPGFAALSSFIARRLRDHAALAGGGLAAPHLAQAGIAGGGSVLDLGAQIDLRFSEKTIGADDAAKFAWSIDSSSAETAFVSGEMAARNQLIIETAIPAHPAYLGGGETATLKPLDATLLANMGKVMHIWLASAASKALLKNWNDAEFNGPTPAIPLEITSFAIGTPALFVRANPADDGVHGGILYTSPDIAIVHEEETTRSVTAVQTDLLNPAHVEAAADIYSNPAAGTNHKNRMFMRAFNKGTMKAKNVHGAMYWTQPSTLALPTAANWKPIANSGTSPNVFSMGDLAAPSGPARTVAVSGQFMWDANLPAFTPGGGDANHYCIIAMTAADNDPVMTGTVAPMPTLAELALRITDMASYLSFVALKNVAWKNIMAVKYVMGMMQAPEHDLDFSKRFPPLWIDKKHLKVPIFLPVLPHAEVAQLEVVNALPKNWQLGVRARKDLATHPVGGKVRADWEAAKGDFVMKELKQDANRLPELYLRAGKQDGMMLDLSLPDFVKPGRYPFGVRQLFKGREIGRLTVIIEMPAFKAGAPDFGSAATH